jgi:ATP-dependent Clp protease ATP-binding subunit ClpA
LDGIITFNKLAKETMVKIITKFMDELRAQVKEKGIRVKLDKESTNWLIAKGFDSKMGARPLQRVIDKEIKRPLAKLMLFGDLKNGGLLTITVQDDRLCLLSTPKESKIPLLSISNNVTENAV